MITKGVFTPGAELPRDPRAAGGVRSPDLRRRGAGDSAAGAASENDAKLAQKLGQLQPSIAVFPQECMGQRVSFEPT